MPRAPAPARPGVDVGHDVVAQLALLLRRAPEVDVVQVRAQRGDRRVGDVEPQLRSASASASQSRRQLPNLKRR